MNYVFGSWMNKMKIAVLGLGIEGKKSVKALLDQEHIVYASDLNQNIDVSEFKSGKLDVDLGCHDQKKIDESDAVVLSPSLWNKDAVKQILGKNKLFSDVLSAHKSIFTIGVTGTNGKTTSCHMIHEILVKAGYNVLMGGNAGGGFDGYTKLIIDANNADYDLMLVEVCDMTLDFASHIFDFDMVLVTNIGFDHMEFHLSIENYLKSICRFLKGKKQVILNGKDPLLVRCKDCAEQTYFFDSKIRKLNLFGTFNQENASGAFKTAELLDIPSNLVEDVLSNFEGVEGRTKTMKLNGSNIIIGKTDNPDATAAVFSEAAVDVMVIGTPRKHEKFRYNILKEVAKTNPSEVVLFPGLDNTTTVAKEVLIQNGYKRPILIVDEISDIIELVLKFTETYHTIFIGGNGQAKIMSLQSSLMQLVHE